MQWQSSSWLLDNWELGDVLNSLSRLSYCETKTNQIFVYSSSKVSFMVAAFWVCFWRSIKYIKLLFLFNVHNKKTKFLNHWEQINCKINLRTYNYGPRCKVSTKKRGVKSFCNNLWFSRSYEKHRFLLWYAVKGAFMDREFYKVSVI